MGNGVGWTRMGWTNCADHCRRTCEFTVLHGAAVILTWFVVVPLQSALLGGWLGDKLFLVPALLFLPTVIKALAAWMYGWWAVLYIMPTALLQFAIVGHSFDLMQLMKLAAYLISAPVVRSCLARIGLDPSKCRTLHTWRFLIVIVVLSSVMLAAVFLILYAQNLSLQEAGLFLGLFVLGDLAGSAFVLIALVFAVRFKERRLRIAGVRREI